MLSGFSKISKSLHEHTIGSAINITTRAYNVCADSDFVFDARPIAYPSFSRFMPIRANSRYMYIYIYICRCLQRISIALPFPCHCSLLFAGKIRYAGRFLFSKDFYALPRILYPPHSFLLSFAVSLRHTIMVVSAGFERVARFVSVREDSCNFCSSTSNRKDVFVSIFCVTKKRLKCCNKLVKEYTCGQFV